MVVTEIRPRRKQLRALYLDGEYAAAVDAATLAEAGWRVGSEVGEEELRALLEASKARRAREKALSLLEVRSHTKRELVEKLRRSVGGEAAQAAADRMEELGLLDDRETARRWAEEFLGRKGYAPRRAAFELERKGIDGETAAQLVEELAGDPDETLLRVLQKKYGRVLGEEAGRRRAAAAMQRLGYSYEQIRRALRRAAPEITDEDEEYNGI